MIRDAFHRLGARFAPSGALRAFGSDCALCPAPFPPDAKRFRFPVKEAAAASNSPPLLFARRVGIRRGDGKVLPTDFCNRLAIHASAKRPFPGRRGFRLYRPTRAP